MRKSIALVMLFTALVGTVGVGSAFACDGNKDSQQSSSDSKSNGK